MKNNIAAWVMVGFMAALLLGNNLDRALQTANIDKRCLVRDTEGRLLVVNLMNGKADYVQRPHTVSADTLEVEQYGWHGETENHP